MPANKTSKPPNVHRYWSPPTLDRPVIRRTATSSDSVVIKVRERIAGWLVPPIGVGRPDVAGRIHISEEPIVASEPRVPAVAIATIMVDARMIEVECTGHRVGGPCGPGVPATIVVPPMAALIRVERSGVARTAVSFDNQRGCRHKGACGDQDNHKHSSNLHGRTPLSKA